MQTRPLGRTGHASTLAIVGTAALGQLDQAGADAALDLALQNGINHLDVAPQYGNAQAVLGPWLESRRDQFFLGCKTLERARDAAWSDLQNSLKVLRTDVIDLYQFHAVTTLEELDAITADGGAAETFRRARDEGLVRYLGITCHGMVAPAVAQEAVTRLDLNTVMVPINPRLYADAGYRAAMEQLLACCQAREVGVQVIKHTAKGPYQGARTHACWYEPYADYDAIEASVHFALSQPGVTCIATTGDVQLLPDIIKAVGEFKPMTAARQSALIEERASDALIFDGPEGISTG